MNPSTAFSGVRSSWLMLARNRSLAWLAASSWTFVSRSSSSKRLLSVTSRMAAMTSMPSSVSSGLRLISTGNSMPSLRRPHSSSSGAHRPLLAEEALLVLRMPAGGSASGISTSMPQPTSSWRV